MSEEYVIIMPSQMKALARYEETFEQYMTGSDFDESRVTFSEKYRMTAEDLCAAVKNLLEKNPTVRDFGEYWYYPLTQMEDDFGITQACGTADDDDDCDEEPRQGPLNVLPWREEDVFGAAWNDLDDIWTLEDEETHLADIDYFKDVLNHLETFLANREKPFREREFTFDQKERYIGFFENDDTVKNATELELAVCRRFTDELCEKDSGAALHLKGYACYGGNRLYGCDWKTSRDCMIRLFEKTDDPYYANTLGYIYYYGRCTGGEPEYEKALEMFTIAAANGLFEGLYKLADMFRHGYACKKSPHTARALYGMVYNDCYEGFLLGKSNSFADAALRMGNVYLYGIGEEADPELAYAYYLQADFAARRRAKNSSFFGDATVALNIRKALDETREKLPAYYFSNYVSITNPSVFYRMAEDGYRVNLWAEKNDDGSVKIKIARLPKRGEKAAKPILMTVSEIDFCDLVTELELTAVKADTSFLDAETPVKYDSCQWIDAEKEIEFYYDEDPVGRISCEEYRIYSREKTPPSGEKLTLVSVAFKPGGRTYDYLCDIEDVKVGDRVIIPGYEGETEAEVTKVYTQYESELGLPKSRYKKVIRKV